jgi:hypothetical protein
MDFILLPETSLKRHHDNFSQLIASSTEFWHEERMKNILLASLMLLALATQAHGVTYDNLQLVQETRKLCRLVDSLEPGSYHFMSCQRHAQNIVSKKKDLIKDTYKICSEGMVSEPHRCYTTLSTSFFSPLLGLDKMGFDQRIAVEEFILGYLFDERASQIPRQANTSELRIYLSLQETLDLVQGSQQTIIDSIIMSCSRMSDWNMLLNPQENDPWFGLQNNCFQAGFNWLEKKLLR